jgi:prophage antirepressor-like protein
MPDIIESLKTKFELVAISLTLAGMMATGVYVYSSQTSQINDHEKKIHLIEARSERHKSEADALERIITATVIPAINSHGEDLLKYESRIETMEKNARADREILLEIRNDLKWMRDKIE